ncbi:uncharacterized protein LOC141852625 [Brevipalpus obovatus]|uniref:uncharacterized protein LOC141852625 n=1 Tax=Brevipalpus obovatus TaxID=246614 RepID=UPI003D9E4FA6
MFTVSKILCPFAIVCFTKPYSNENRCPKPCQCYQSMEKDSMSAICGPISIKDVQNLSLHTLALANITFDDRVLIGDELNSIQFEHLSIESCGGTPQVTSDRPNRLRIASDQTVIKHRSLTITNSRNIFDWKWSPYGFQHVLIESGRLYAFQRPVLSRKFVVKVIGSQVKSVAIIDCKLTAIENGAFNQLSVMKSLRLSRNKLKEIKSTHFADQHPHLKQIDLSHNLIETLATSLFNQFPSLQELNLSNNRLVKLDWLRPVLKKLDFIDLTDNPIDCKTMCWYSSPASAPHPPILDITECVYRQNRLPLYDFDAKQFECGN